MVGREKKRMTLSRYEKADHVHAGLSRAKAEAGTVPRHRRENGPRKKGLYHCGSVGNLETTSLSKSSCGKRREAKQKKTHATASSRIFENLNDGRRAAATKGRSAVTKAEKIEGNLKASAQLVD